MVPLLLDLTEEEEKVLIDVLVEWRAETTRARHVSVQDRSLDTADDLLEVDAEYQKHLRIIDQILDKMGVDD
jgi:hypothetical protein